MVGLLILQRPPFRMVDRIDALDLGERPTVRASRYLTANEPFFEGHFPGRPILPGVLTLEAMAQSARALATCVALARRLGPEPLLDALRSAELSTTTGAAAPDPLEAELRAGSQTPPMVLGALQARLLRPVFPGCRLELQAEIVRELDLGIHFALGASVDGQPVARATASAAPLG